jgi:hypothetical protein
MSIKNFLLFTIACSFMTFGAKAQNTSEQAENATHYIEGDYSVEAVNGKFVYKLQNITSQGITFTKEDVKIGTEIDEFAVFEFEHADTDYPTKFAGGLKFWKWDYDNNKWQIDSETKDGQLGSSTNKVMTIMLVLDCSTSLGNDFDKLKVYAEQFITTIYNKSSNGNVRLGIVGFNTMTYTKNTVYPITELTSNSYTEMKSFIRRLTIDKQTAMYYAMHTATDMMESYVNGIYLPDNVEYDGSYIVTFTDGYDNNSRDPKIGVPADGILNPYYKYVKEKCITKKLKGKPIESFVIAVEGNDVGSNASKFEEVLRGLSTDNSHFKLAKNFNELQYMFEDIANNLIDRWNNLICFVPPSHKGRVRWTLGYAQAPKPKPEPKPIVKTKSKTRFNINIGLTTMNVKESGYGFTEKYSLAGKKDATTKGLYLGVSWDHSFKYGLGIEFCDLGLAYYRGSDSEYYYDGNLKTTAKSFNMYLSPIKFQYRYETPSTFAVFAATGPALDFCIDHSVKYEYYDSYYGGGVTSTESDIYKSLYFYWDLKGGVAYKFMKLTLGTSMRMNNVSKYPDYTAKVGRPFYVMFSFVF